MLVPSLVLLLAVSGLQAAELPPGLIPCKDDANLNACAEKNSAAVIKGVAKGNKKFKIPVLDPMYIERIAILDKGEKSISLNSTFDRLNLHGLSDSVFKAQLDTKKRIFKWTFLVKEIRWLSDYEIKGKFLLVPIVGKGKMSVNITEPELVYTFEYGLENRNGKEYAFIKPNKSLLTYKPKKLTLHLENLFNGDKALGNSLNNMINENWKDFNDQLAPGVVKGIQKVMEDVFKNILNAVPYNELILK